MPTSKPTMLYPTEELRSEWEEKAESMDMSLSEWCQSMIFAGQKPFDASTEPDETHEELRQQRNDLRDELAHARERVEELESELYDSERQEVMNFVTSEGGVSFEAITSHVQDTAPSRVTQHLEALEGEELTQDKEGFHATDS